MAEDPPKVVDLNQRRLDKALESAAGFEVVQLIACTNCASAQFRLAHDGRIICSSCNLWIEPLRWYDATSPLPPTA